MEQWYETHHDLYEKEVSSMHHFWPNAKQGFLEDGRMYWHLSIKTGFSPRVWEVIGIYESDYPSGESLRFFPISPNTNEMKCLIDEANVFPKVIPSLYRYYSRKHNSNFKWGGAMLTGYSDSVSATTAFAHIANWIASFELAIEDEELWSAFCKNMGERI